jgi:sugar phosphate isomerase/epimerase
MKKSQIAAQLYTVREHMQDAAGLAQSLKRLRAMGYTAAQLSGGPKIPATELIEIFDGEGMVCCATHEPAPMILGEPAAVVERLRTLRCRLTAYPHPKGVDFSSAEAVRQLIADLGAAAAVFAQAGITLGYHNHDTEFLPFEGGTVLAAILDGAPQLVAELDTYWVQAGGGEVVQWIERLPGRVPFIHLKDYGMTLPRERYFAEIGRGNLDWSRIIPAAEAAGCEWFIVERDSGERDPFESLQMSYDYLSEHFTTDAPLAGKV